MRYAQHAGADPGESEQIRKFVRHGHVVKAVLDISGSHVKRAVVNLQSTERTGAGEATGPRVFESRVHQAGVKDQTLLPSLFVDKEDAKLAGHAVIFEVNQLLGDSEPFRDAKLQFQCD